MQPPPPAPIYHADFSLSEDEEAVRELFSTFFAKECPPERVRAAEPDGFDHDLWTHLSGLNVVGMALAPEVGGDGAGLVELVLLAEAWGHAVAPVPIAEAVVAARLLGALAASSPDARAALDHALSGASLTTLALHPVTVGQPQLVPAGAVADHALALVEDAVVLAPARGTRVPNTGHAPLAWLHLAEGTPVARGPEAVAAYRAALREWRLVMAGALTGMADATLSIAVQHAKERIAFGVPIGSFQAVAHPLVDVAMNVEMARRLTRKAAWWADQDAAQHRELIPMAYRFAEHTAIHGTAVGVHTLGGVGFTVESDVQLYFRRAKGWSLVAGDPDLALDEVALELFGAPRAQATTPVEVPQ